jgi:hypothetical protein
MGEADRYALTNPGHTVSVKPSRLSFSSFSSNFYLFKNQLTRICKALLLHDLPSLSSSLVARRMGHHAMTLGGSFDPSNIFSFRISKVRITNPI